ncbi:Chondroadherin-Like Protein [Manis pentadactyla]|nr:Chondroadherin-Like Protein [Manis pentadactyla]
MGQISWQLADIITADPGMRWQRFPFLEQEWRPLHCRIAQPSSPPPELRGGKIQQRQGALSGCEGWEGAKIRRSHVKINRRIPQNFLLYSRTGLFT